MQRGILDWAQGQKKDFTGKTEILIKSVDLALCIVPILIS